MHVYADPFWLPKQGNTEEEYEDACCPRKVTERASCSFRCAVADGATETSFSGLWAGLLVQAFGSGRLTSKRRQETLRSLQGRWLSQVSAHPLPWFAEEKARCGAFSSLLGLELGEASICGGGRWWRACAVGDSCLVQMRGDAILSSFPIRDSRAFNNRPLLLSSNPGRNKEATTMWTSRGGTWESEDAFYLMTDALACWFLTEAEKGQQPWRRLRDPQTGDGTFAELIAELRRNGRMRNDDVTLLRVTVD